MSMLVLNFFACVDSGEFQGHPRNVILIAAVLFLSAKICCTDGAVCVSALLMVNQPFLILLSFQAFSMDLLPRTLQNLPVAMRFNRLVWRN